VTSVKHNLCLLCQAAARLRLQQESKPEQIQKIDRQQITLMIELEVRRLSKVRFTERFDKLTFELKQALRKETDEASTETKEKIAKEVKTLQEQSEKLNVKYHQ